MKHDQMNHDLGGGATLRPLLQDHAAAFYTHIANNHEFLATYLGWVDNITTTETAAQYIARGEARAAENGLPWFGIWQDEDLVGGIVFFPKDTFVNSIELGYWLAQNVAGQGLMQRAMRAVLEILFETLHINRVVIHADVRNGPSKKLAERLGFVFEGVERQSWVLRGAYTDNALYALLAEDWRSGLP